LKGRNVTINNNRLLLIRQLILLKNIMLFIDQLPLIEKAKYSVQKKGDDLSHPLIKNTSN